jgi:putative peptidoglycan lipid II flippase
VIQALTGYIGRWNAWTSVSINRRIFAASVIVAAWTLLVHLATALKDVIVAYQFGTTDVLDAFLIAFLLPSFLVSVIAGSLPSAFVPISQEVQRREGQAAGEALYAGVMGWGLMILIMIFVLMVALAPVVLPALASGFSEEKLNLTRTLYFMMLPIVVCRGLTAIWTTKLNVNEQFAFGSAIPILSPVLSLACLIYGVERWGIYALSAGTVVGALLETLITGWYVHTLGVGVMPQVSAWSSNLKKVARQYGPSAVGALLMASTILVDQAMAAMLGAGSVTALNFGGKIVSFAVAIGATALGTAVLPYFSEMVSTGDWAGIDHTLRKYVGLILKVTIPLTLLGVVLSGQIVGALFQRGAFTAMDTGLVGDVQAVLLLQLPLYLVGTVVVRLLSALKANHILMWGCVLNCLLNILLNYVLMQWLDVVGIALATFVVYVSSVTFLSYMLRRILVEQRRVSDCQPTTSNVH